MISTGFGGALNAVPTEGAGQDQVTCGEVLKPGQRLQRLQWLVEHVTVDQHVLAQFTVHAQAQSQIAKALEFVTVEQHQHPAPPV